MINMTQTSVLKRDDQGVFSFEKLNRDTISRILGTIVYDKAFFFYEEIGKPTGEYAISLLDFCSKINTVPSKCLIFHLKRGDFENWILKVIGDVELCKRVGDLKTKKAILKNDARLRNKLHAVLRDRVVELQDLWHQALTWPLPNNA